MALTYAGDGSIDGDWFNAVVDAVKALQAGGGGSQSVQVIRIPITPTTPDILTGIDVGYTPSVGDLITVNGSVTVAWDGSSPKAHIYLDGDDPDTSDLEQTTALGSTNSQTGTGGSSVIVNWAFGSYGNVIDVSSPLKLIVDDGSGGDPGSAVGVAEIIIVIIPVSP